MNHLSGLFAQPWAERLGWTLLHFLWEGTTIAVLLATLGALPRSARWRYILASAALGAMAAAPLATYAWLGGVGLAGPAVAPAAGAATLPALGGAAMTASPLQSAMPWLVMAWLCGVTGFSARLALSWISAARLRSAGACPAPGEWQETIDRLAHRLGVSRPVRLLVTSRVDAPAVLGWLRPVVLAPLAVLTGLPPEQVEALLIHELAHIQRNDYLVNLLQSVAEAVLFYHPAVWWVSNRIRVERELCCDDLAVEASGDVLTYARALTEMESCRPRHASVAVAASGGALMLRIRRLVEPSGHAHRLAGPGAAGALGALLLVAVGAVAIGGAQEPGRRAGGQYPTVDRSSIWADTVKLGDLPLQVRALGVLNSSTKAELKVAEPQMKDVQVGMPAAIGFRQSAEVVKGHVAGLRPGVVNGVATVDVQVDGPLPPFAQAGTQIDSAIQVGTLSNVVYVGRPVFGQSNTEGTLFRVEPDGTQAVRVKVMFGRASVQQIEIRSGLQPGDHVIVSDMTQYKDRERIYLK